jgi:hypothetical protein
MNKQEKIETLILELEKIEPVSRRISLIYEDVQKKNPRFKILAEEDPYRLFDLLGGDDSDISKCNWAKEYSYEDYIEENGLEFDPEEEDYWDAEEQGIQRAQDSGHYYVTGYSLIQGPNDIELQFEFQFCEGYIDGIIGTPYNKAHHGKHGISF